MSSLALNMVFILYGVAMRPPLSEPPRKPTNWWKTIPGQLAILTMIIGAVLILCQLSGAAELRYR